MSTFDPAAHLHKQGWKGKGTALKQGHATRPLAVVQKKNLGGIGRDRDEAIPFWDQIFASTAASIFTPSPTPSGSSTPIPLNSAHTSTRSWTTTTFGAPTVQVKKAGTVSVAARVNKEQAKKGLYSRFFRGKVVEPEESEAEIEVDTAVESSSTNPNINEETEAGPSNSITDSTISIPNNDNDTESKGAKKSNGNGKGKGKGKERDGETKEERRARRAEKAKRKLEREERKALRAATVPTAEVQGGEAISGDGKGRIKRKRKDEDEMVDGVDHTIDKKVEVKRVKADKEPVEDVGSNEDMELDDRKLKKKKDKKEKKGKKLKKAKRETVD